MMSGTPQISIVIPTKNRPDLVRQTLDSVIEQSFHEWEAIVVDDGSTDDTKDVVQQYVVANQRIRLFDRVGDVSGANVCRNQGARIATTDLLIFLDSDDLLDVDCLSHRVNFMKRNQDFDFFVCHAEAFRETLRDLNKRADVFSDTGDLDRFLYFDVPWLITGPTWRKASFLNLGGFDETIPSWQDVELHVRAILAGLTYHNSRIVDYHVRWQNDPEKTSLQQRRNPDHLLAGERIIDSFHQSLIQSGCLNWSRLRGIAAMKYFVAELWVAQGEYTHAKRVWKNTKNAGQASSTFYRSGKTLLTLLRWQRTDAGWISRIRHKWKGWCRLRDQPEILK